MSSRHTLVTLRCTCLACNSMAAFPKHGMGGQPTSPLSRWPTYYNNLRSLINSQWAWLRIVCKATLPVDINIDFHISSSIDETVLDMIHTHIGSHENSRCSTSFRHHIASFAVMTSPHNCAVDYRLLSRLRLLMRTFLVATTRTADSSDVVPSTDTIMIQIMHVFELVTHWRHLFRTFSYHYKNHFLFIPVYAWVSEKCTNILYFFVLCALFSMCTHFSTCVIPNFRHVTHI